MDPSIGDIKAANVGARVTWADPHPVDVGEVGVVTQPTPEDLAYFAEQGYPANRCVLVSWQGDDWDMAWHDPSELRLIVGPPEPEEQQ